MLAKVWKKALLAVCIIACIYNVMNKLVSRTSLEIQLKSVQNQTSLTETTPNEEEENRSQESREEDNSKKNTEVNNNVVSNESSNDDDTIVVIY